MIRQQARGRAGITLTEILIAIMILGVGMIALVTLFPIGLLRMRAATRMTRSALLVETAASELETRNLLSANSFINGLSGSYGVNPWISDGPPAGGGVYRGTTNIGPGGVPGAPGPGLPVAYDPLWCAMVFNQTGAFPPTGTASSVGRFGAGAATGYLRPDPNTASTSYAWGLQRVSNFSPTLYSASGAVTAAVSNAYQYNIVSNIFVSQEDVVWNSENDKSTAAAGVIASPVLPDLFMGGSSAGFPTLDWRYSWFFTGTQSDADDATMFDGDVVICENRQFNLDTSTNQVVGETVVEAIFGYSTSPVNGYGLNASRTVLLHWPATMPDPEIKVGDWIADVTYEVSLKNDLAIRTFESTNGMTVYPNQRCYWYQVAKKTAPDTDVSSGAPAGYRSMTVWVTTPLQAFTLLGAGGKPHSLNAALIMPSVVNVFPRTVYSR
jgi:hypothetical protein